MDVTRDDVVTAKLAHVASMFFGPPLAVTSDRALQIKAFLVRRMRGEPSAVVEVVDMPGGLSVSMTPEGVASVDLRATLTPKDAGGIDALSGLVSHERLGKTLAGLAADIDVRGVVVAMDSPGGSVMGITDSVDAMRALAAVKPVYVVADHLMASAAYWIGSQATKVFVAETSVIGSIGSLMVRQDSTAADKAAGEAWHFISNMGRKGDGDEHKGISPEEIAEKRAVVAQADDMFFAAVARARPITIAAIKKLDGASVMGRASIDAGLADDVGTVADAIAALTATLKPLTTNGRRPATRSGARAEEGHTMSTNIDPGQPNTGVILGSAEVIDITKDPRFAQAVDAKAKAMAAEALERDREIRGLCAIFGVAADETETLVASNQSRADIYAALQEARVKADEAGDTRGQHAGGGAGGKSRRETQDTEAAVSAEYGERRKIHAEARREFFGGRA